MGTLVIPRSDFLTHLSPFWFILNDDFYFYLELIFFSKFSLVSISFLAKNFRENSIMTSGIKEIFYNLHHTKVEVFRERKIFFFYSNLVYGLSLSWNSQTEGRQGLFVC